MSVGSIIGGFVLIALGLLDLFLTVFNFDGFTFIAARYQRGLWRLIRWSSKAVPRRARPAALAFGSERYRHWLRFAHRRDLVLRRVGERLGYDTDEVRGSELSVR